MSSGSHVAKPSRKPKAPAGSRAPAGFGKNVVLILILVVLLAVLAIIVNMLRTAEPAKYRHVPGDTTLPAATAAPTFRPTAEPTPPPVEPTPEETPETVVTPTPVPEFHPYHTDATNPEDFVKQLAVNVDGTTLAEDEVYQAEDEIDFYTGDEYTDLPGVITFRGNNFRDSAAYGFAEASRYKFGTSWSFNTGTLTAPDGETWSGSGWVGQPLIVKWPKETKAVMNMYDWAKADDTLVEVIYATMDGNIYCRDLATGKQARDTLRVGYTFKGAGALDPRG